jgi:hypothetical protein
MKPRGLVFGIVFLLLGACVLVGGSLAYSSRLRSEAKVAQGHPNQWHLVLSEPSVFEDEAGWAGLISVSAGFILLAVETVKFMRRRQLQ